MLAGSLIFETPIDTTGIENGAKEIKGEFDGLKSVADETGRTINSAFSGDFSKPIASAQARINDLLRQFETVSASLKNAIAVDDDSAAEKYGRKQIRIYDQIEAAREKLLIEIQEASHKQAEAERKAAEKTQIAAEKMNKSLAKTASSAKTVKKESLGIVKGFTGASKAVKRFGSRLAGIVSSAFVFTFISQGLREFTSYLGTALKNNKEFSVELAKLKGALLTAFQPIYSYILPVIVKLMQFLTSAANVIAYFFSAMRGILIQNSAQAAENLYNQANALDSVGSSAKKAKKALAGFDELNVLTAQNDSADGAGNIGSPDFSSFNNFNIPDVATILKNKILDGNWYGAGKIIGESLTDGIENVEWGKTGTNIGKLIGDAIFAVLGFLLNIDPDVMLESATNFVTGLVEGLSTSIQNQDWMVFGSDVMQKLIDALKLTFYMYNPGLLLIELLFSPTGQDFLSSAAEFAGSVIGALFAAIVGAGKKIGEIGLEIWNTIKTYLDDNIDWDDSPGEIISGLLEGIKEALIDIGTWIYNNIWVPFRDGFKEAFGINSPSTKMKEFGGYMMDGLYNGIVDAIDKVKEACRTIWDAIKGCFSPVGTWFKTTFSNAWTAVKDVFSKGGKIFTGIKEGIAETFKTIVNGLITGINKVIAAPFNSINGVLNTIRNIKILDFQPFAGLWSYNPLAVPQIPKLARGAVLPANKPFMAVVGDQRHGTNVEAPLSVIQEAVAAVMADYAASNLAGHEATVAVLRELLEAVLGIQIGDDVIANAVSRYDKKMAVVRGG